MHGSMESMAIKQRACSVSPLTSLGLDALGKAAIAIFHSVGTLEKIDYT